MENLTIITLVLNALVVGLLLFVIRRWTAEAKEEAKTAVTVSKDEVNKVAEAVKEELNRLEKLLESFKKEIVETLEKEVARLHAEVVAMVPLLDKKLDTTLFEARAELGRSELKLLDQKLEGISKDVDRFETCISELRKVLLSVKLSISSGV